MTGKEKKIRSSFAVSEVRGEIKASDLVQVLEQKCGARTMSIDPSSRFNQKRMPTKLTRCKAGRYDVVDGPSPQILRIDFKSPWGGMSRSRELLANGN